MNFIEKYIFEQFKLVANKYEEIQIEKKIHFSDEALLAYNAEYLSMTCFGTAESDLLEKDIDFQKYISYMIEIEKILLEVKLLFKISVSKINNKVDLERLANIIDSYNSNLGFYELFKEIN